MRKENNYAFIDSNNLYLGVKEHQWNIDYARFRVFLKDKYAVQKAFLFIGFIPENHLLYANLQKAGYICIFKPTLQIIEKGKTKTKGNIDAELVLHTMLEIENYDKAVIVTADGDFYCLIEYLEKTKKLKKIITPNKRYSSFLRKYSKHIVNIQSFKNKIALKSK
jgi:uncharacterized LabA/DUF88 family protein